MIHARMLGRHEIDTESIEATMHDLPAQSVDFVKLILETWLIKSDYLRKDIYYSGKNFESYAFSIDSDAFRHEPILIDDGGTYVNGKRVLKIAVRYADTINKELDAEIREMLNEIGIKKPKKGSEEDCEEGTKVYALRRV